jgi:3-hydroxyacyl-CoA dehydrogenase
LVPAIADPNRQTDLAAAVLFGVGSSLMADADIREFGQLASAPSPAGLPTKETFPDPVVAALQGSALDHDLRVALWSLSRYREPSRR